MNAVEVADDVDERLALLARAMGVSKGEVVRRLLMEYAQPSPDPAPAPPRRRGVEIHVFYEGRRTDATYDPVTKRVDITSGPLAGQSFKRPSGAAIAVIQEANDTVNPNRNGWTFWTVTETGKRLQSLRHEV